MVAESIPPSPSRFSLSLQPSKLEPLHLSFNEIIKLTRNFSPSQVIGEDGFATTYKAELPDGQVIAIKRAKKVTIMIRLLSNLAMLMQVHM